MADGSIRFFVDHPPIAQPRHKVSTRGGFARAYIAKSHAIHGYKAAVKKAAEFIEPLNGALEMELWCFFKRPSSHFKTKNGQVTSELKPSAPVFYDKIPDYDNLAKAVMDALNKIAYPDDKHIVDGHIHKRYACESWPVGVVIGIREMDVEVGMPVWMGYQKLLSEIEV